MPGTSIQLRPVYFQREKAAALSSLCGRSVGATSGGVGHHNLDLGSGMLQLGENCIWCKGSTDESDLSHVMPECFGNTEQVLPPGIVCYSCNHYFGSKIEPSLFEDPVIHTMCVMFHVVDPGDGKVFRERLFNRHHISADIPRLTPKLAVTVSSDGSSPHHFRGSL
jgi:hypothetical protein